MKDDDGDESYESMGDRKHHKAKADHFFGPFFIMVLRV